MHTTHVLFTGGTIAMRTNSDGLLIPACTGNELLQAIPQLSQFHISTEQRSNLASAHLTDAHWIETYHAIVHACARPEVCGVVVVQGTDTLEETAFFLDCVLSPNLTHNKPIVLTGAMLNADDIHSDGPINLFNAIALTQTRPLPEHIPVMVTMHDQIHAARAVQKHHSTERNAFSSVHHPALGTLDFVATQLNTLQSSHFTPHVSLPQSTAHLPRVDLINVYVGSDACHIHASIEAGAQALVMIALGAGNLNPIQYHAIERALNAHIPVIIASRCWDGNAEPHYGYIGGGQTLAQLGCAFAHDLPAHKARILAQVALASNPGATAISTIQNIFSQLTLSTLSQQASNEL